MIKKGDLYYPSKEFQKKALVNNRAVYKKAEKNPLKFWEGLAKELKWQKKWKKVFEQKPPYFKWFLGGKINIAENALDRNLEKLGDKIALIWEPEPAGEKEKTFTYNDLSKEVNKFANALKKLGVKKGDRVGIYLPMIPEIVISMLASARIGAVHCVIFSAFSPQALKVRLQDTGAKILITADGYHRRGKIISLKQLADEGIKETEVEKVAVVKRAGNDVLMENGRDFWWNDLVLEESPECEPEPMDSEDPLFILYTSGSTGKPKGCVHVSGGYAVQAYWTGKWIFDLKDDDVFWCTADIGWVTGHTYGVYSPLMNGMTFVMYEGSLDWPNPDRWCDIIEKHKITTFYTAPTAIRMFEKYGAEFVRKHKLDKLQILGSVGEPIDESAWLWYFTEVGKSRCPVVDTWWQTETGGILISSLPGTGPFKPTFAGIPFPGVKFDILDEKGKSLKKNKEGNLVIKPPFSPGLFRNIYKNPEKYLETYWSQYDKKFYFTSDGAYRDENGLIRIIGRVDDVIKVAGHRITTGELESAAALHKDITESAAIGLPDEIKGEVPVIFVCGNKIFDESGNPNENIKQEVVDLIRKQIGPIASPKEVYLAKDLPKTRSGKIMRRILRKLFTNEDLGDLSTLSNPESVEELKKIIR
ncbi:MAG: acetate--CoA ligase [Candidatus Staskawiczbacteria bacterium]|nr:acetate--CoA ligase [Candidatus Staskawiczbacteria bacterium]